MGKPQPRYTPEFQQQMVSLHRAGRTVKALSSEFGVTSWTIRYWVKQAERDAGKGDGGLTTAERDILSKAAAWFANEKTAIPKRSSDS